MSTHSLPLSRSSPYNLDGQNYMRTHRFLEENAKRGSSLARLGVKCLELNKSLGLCDAEMPWVVKTNYLKFDVVATLPIDAANKAHFCLGALLLNPSKKFPFQDMTFAVEFDESELQKWVLIFLLDGSPRALEDVVSFLENLRGRKLDHNIDAEAERLAQRLEEVIIVERDFRIDEKAIQMLFSQIGDNSLTRAIPNQ
ncbi:hypothetical protein GYMLUDRAFT_62110 [Collybiopsis luxurians FD-317 M1]|uniref:Uncharacterized protein n=1 Tax=Collybiopsis luxurians FD-317 M1 TaxID=944289 RepID=A0A0D0BMU8_9AGAR|nr:hypothetical protein GYMLUDRAFT_62110 [Collybiopsis luxurians FD-317 M1]